MVIIFPCRSRLIIPNKLARVVDLPEPQGPTTKTKPSFKKAKRCNCSFKPIDSGLGITSEMNRAVSPKTPRW